MSQDIETINDIAIEAYLDKYADDQALEKEYTERQKKVNRSISYSRMSKRKFVIEETNWGASVQERQSVIGRLTAQAHELALADRLISNCDMQGIQFSLEGYI